MSYCEIKYLEDKKILISSIIQNKMDKEQAKLIFEEVNKAFSDYSEYTDFILDTGNVKDVTIASFGYLMKAFSLVKKTADYMVIVMQEDILQNFMLTNPELFDFLAVFFNIEEAVEFIESKR